MISLYVFQVFLIVMAMGRESQVVKKTFTSRYHETKTIDVELFTWEKLDRIDDIKREFGI